MRLTDDEIRAKVTNLKNFYNQSFVHAVTNVFMLLIWVLLSPGPYWPIWVHFASGAILMIEAARLNLFKIPNTDMLPFLRKEWEEATFKRFKRECEHQEKVTEKTQSNDKPIPKTLTTDAKPTTTISKKAKSTKRS